MIEPTIAMIELFETEWGGTFFRYYRRCNRTERDNSGLRLYRKKGLLGEEFAVKLQDDVLGPGFFYGIS
jgi:hypothetical protein